MTYAEVARYLGALSPLGVQLGTARVAEALRRLGDPQRRFVALHIAGTNGKGSTAAMTASLLRAAGGASTIALYTSPHLLRLTERLQISEGGAPFTECPEAEFAAAVGAVRQAAARRPALDLTFFEVLTAAAFCWFAGRGVEIAVIETGLGGRLDATRLCEPVGTAVTSIGLDHTELLGATLPEIAREKAGIFRPGVPALCACDDAAALDALAEEAGRVGAPLFQVDTGIGLHRACAGVVPPLPEALRAAVPLPGAHQRRNAALAVALSRLAPGFRTLLTEDQPALREGLSRARWPGRLERIDAAGVTVWLDAAHNPEGAGALAEWLAEAGPAQVVLFGVVAGKRVEGMLAPLARAEAVVLTRPASPRALAPEVLLPLVRAYALSAETPRVMIIPEAEAALAAALRLVPPGGSLLIYGSIFLLGVARRVLLGETADPMPLQDPVRAAQAG
jgi:dihydrofolate synthase/folylpolyglutamate synthase